MSEGPEAGTDVGLVGRLRDLRDAAAWAAFVERYTPPLYDWCRGRGLQHADAEDVTQAVLLKLVRRMQTFVYRPDGSLRGWLRTVTRNAWKDFLEEAARQARGSGDTRVLQHLHEVAGPEEGLLAALDTAFREEVRDEALARVLRDAEPASREAFRLLVYEGLSAKVVAARVGKTPGAVLTLKCKLLARARAVAEQLAPQEFE